MSRQPGLAEAGQQAAQTEPAPRTLGIKPKSLILRILPYRCRDTSMQALGIDALSELLGRRRR